MQARKPTTVAMAWAWLRAMSWRDRVGLVLAILFALVVLGAALGQGYLVGDRVWRPGWICGHMINSSNPWCIRDPEGGLQR